MRGHFERKAGGGAEAGQDAWRVPGPVQVPPPLRPAAVPRGVAREGREHARRAARRVEEGHGRAHTRPRAAAPIDERQQAARNSDGVRTGEPERLGAAAAPATSAVRTVAPHDEREPVARVGDEAGPFGIEQADADVPAGADIADQNALARAAAVVDDSGEVDELPEPAGAKHAEHRTGGEDPGDRGGGPPGDQYVLAPPTPKLIAVAPGRELRPQRRPDAHELRPVRHAREPDIIGRRAQPRAAEQPLGLLDRLPPLFLRRQVPPLAPAAHHPQAALGCVVGEPAPNREVLHRFVPAEVRVAEEARGVHV